MINIKIPLLILKYQWQLDNKMRVMRSPAKKKSGLTQNHDKTNRIRAASRREGRKGHKGIRVSESSCVSPESVVSGCITQFM